LKSSNTAFLVMLAAANQRQAPSSRSLGAVHDGHGENPGTSFARNPPGARGVNRRKVNDVTIEAGDAGDQLGEDGGYGRSRRRPVDRRAGPTGSRASPQSLRARPIGQLSRFGFSFRSSP